MFHLFFFLLLSLLSFIDLKAQVYKFEYNVGVVVNQSKADSIPTEAMKLLHVNLTYKCMANFLYLKVKGSYMNSSVDAQQAGASEIIMDFKEGIVYFPELKTFEKNKSYKLKHEKENIYSIEGFGRGYEVLLDKKLPKQVTPCILFSNAKYGIKYIKTPDFVIQLIENSVTEIKDKLDFEKIFQEKDKKDILKTFEFIR